jgi:cell division transport system permease protein
MASNREIVEVLHFVGATDKFISREFEKHFLRLGIKAGIVGATCAMVVFMSMPAITELLGGGAVSAVEMQRLIGTGSLDALGYLILGLVVVIIAGLCMGTSRFGVHRILNGKH